MASAGKNPGNDFVFLNSKQAQERGGSPYIDKDLNNPSDSLPTCSQPRPPLSHHQHYQVRVLRVYVCKFVYMYVRVYVCLRACACV